MSPWRYEAEVISRTDVDSHTVATARARPPARIDSHFGDRRRDRSARRPVRSFVPSAMTFAVVPSALWRSVEVLSSVCDPVIGRPCRGRPLMVRGAITFGLGANALEAAPEARRVSPRGPVRW